MKQMMVDGWTDEDIITQLNEEYAEKLDNPEQPDVTVLIYVLPFIFGSLAVFVVFRSWRKGHHEENRGLADALQESGDSPQEIEGVQDREERLAKLRQRIRTDD